MPTIATDRKMKNIPFLPAFFLMAGTIGMNMNAGMDPSPMKMDIWAVVEWMLYCI